MHSYPWHELQLDVELHTLVCLHTAKDPGGWVDTKRSRHSVTKNRIPDHVGNLTALVQLVAFVGTNTVSSTIQDVPGKVNILGGNSIGHFKKKWLYEKCPIPNGFRYLARNIFLPSRHNASMSEACESVWSVSWLLLLLIEREGRKILRARLKKLRAKYRKPFEIGHMYI
jgi:hypothetical protein